MVVDEYDLLTYLITYFLKNIVEDYDVLYDCLLLVSCSESKLVI